MASSESLSNLSKSQKIEFLTLGLKFKISFFFILADMFLIF